VQSHVTREPEGCNISNGRRFLLVEGASRAKASVGDGAVMADRKLTIPNLLTAGRIAMVPGMMGCWYLHAPCAAAGLFGVAAFTDFLDGYVARRFGQQSKLGALLDPLADKLLLAGASFLLVEHSAHAYVTVPAALILFRELTVSSLREWMHSHHPEKSGGLAVAWHGKVKAALQLLALQIMLLGAALGGGSHPPHQQQQPLGTEPLPFADKVHFAGVVTLWLASAVTVASGAQYVRFAMSA